MLDIRCGPCFPLFGSSGLPSAFAVASIVPVVRQSRRGVSAVARSARSSSATASTCLPKSDGRAAGQLRAAAENRPPQRQKMMPTHRQMQEDPVGRPDIARSRHAGRAPLGSSPDDRRPARRFPETRPFWRAARSRRSACPPACDARGSPAAGSAGTSRWRRRSAGCRPRARCAADQHVAFGAQQHFGGRRAEPAARRARFHSWHRRRRARLGTPESVPTLAAGESLDA